MDASGEEIEHGYYFSAINKTRHHYGGIVFDFDGGYLPVDMERRKVIPSNSPILHGLVNKGREGVVCPTKLR